MLIRNEKLLVLVFLNLQRLGIITTMNRSISKSFRLTTCAMCLALLSSCSGDVPPDRSKTENIGQASNALNNLASSGESDGHSHDIAEESANTDGTNNVDEAVSDSHKDINQELSRDHQAEDEYNDEFYDEPSRTLSIDPNPSEGIIRWVQPQDLAYSNAQITLFSDSGETLVRDFSAGESIELYGELPDGVYGWESVITPQISESVRSEMREVRASGDFEAERELVAALRAEGSLPTEQEARDNVQSGSFVVLNGVVNPPSTQEQSDFDR